MYNIIENRKSKAEYLYKNARDTKNWKSVPIYPASPYVILVYGHFENLRTDI